MIGRLLITSALVAWACSATAAECNRGNGAVLSIVDWTMGEKRADKTFDLTFEISSQAAKPTKMVEATIWFEDSLGRSLNGWNLDPDFLVKPGSTAPFVLKLGEVSFDGRPLGREDISAKLCTIAILYEDGTTDEFASRY